MRDIKDIRQDINDVDEQIASLYQKRMNLSLEVAEYKKNNNLPILDAKREEEVILRNLELIKDESIKTYYHQFLTELMRESKEHQQDYLSKQDKIVKVNVNPSYEVVIKNGLINELDKYLDVKKKTLIVSDSLIPNIYVDLVKNQLENAYVVIFDAGEKNKNFLSYEKILSELYKNEFTRQDNILALGGGLVSDVTGFAASSYMRGINFYIISTSLLGQVDASVGGKVAINYINRKNLIGAFYQPKKVLIDVDTLKTLDSRIYNEGFAEIIKMAATLDPELFNYLEKSSLEEINDNINDIIYRSIKLKADIVSVDEKENGLRRVLNFGHTVGHAIEGLSQGYLLHGESVAIGMTYMVNPKIKERLNNLLLKFHLPTSINFGVDEIIEYIKLDKKKMDDDSIIIVYLNDIGDYEFKNVNFKTLKEMIGGR